MKISIKKMSKLLGVAFFFLGVLGHLDAQKFEFGLRYMPTFSSVEIVTPGDGRLQTDLTAGYGIGGLLAFNFKKHIGVQAEVIYSSLSQKYTEAGSERVINLKYLNVPLLLSLNTGILNAINLNAVVGPQIGVSAGSNLSGTDSGTGKAVLAVKKGDLGFAYGAGLSFGLNAARTIRFGLGFRGVLGLLDISDNTKTQETDSYYIFDKSKVKSYSGYAGVSILF